MHPVEVGLDAPGIESCVVGHRTGADLVVCPEGEARELQRRELRDQRGREAQLPGIISTRVQTAGYLFVPGQSAPKIE